MSSAIASTTMSTSASASRLVAPVNRASTASLASSSSLPFAIALSRFLVIWRDDAVDLLVGATDEHDVVAGLREHLGDAGRHRAGADDADRVDLVAQLGLVGIVGCGRLRRARRSTGAGWCSGSPVSAYSFSSPEATTSAPSASMRASGPIG